MNDELKQQMQTDIELAKSMSDINSPAEILDLTNRMIGYMDLILSTKADLNYKVNQLEGKKRTLEEYIRTSKERYKEIKDFNNRS